MTVAQDEGTPEARDQSAPAWVLGYAAAVVSGSFAFIAISVYLDSLHPSPEVQPPLSYPKLLVDIIFWFGFAMPLSMMLAAVPFAIGLAISRWLRLRHLLYFIAAGALCGRAMFWILPFGANGLVPSWLAGMIGGLVYWVVAVRTAPR